MRFFKTAFKKTALVISLFAAAGILMMGCPDDTELGAGTETDPVEVTVQFDTAGGSPVEPITVLSGTSMGDQYPADPVLDGHTFAGWYDGETEYTENTPITGSITLVAHWTEGAPPTVTVTFDSAGGSAVDSITLVINTKMGLDFPAEPTKDDYVFGGWYHNATPYTADTIIHEDITLTAKWTRVQVTVMFNTESDSEIEPVMIDKGSSLGDQFPANPTMDDWDFVGWFVGEVEYKRDTPINENITLTAEWKLAQVIVTFDANGGSPTPAPITIDKGSALNDKFPADPTKSGFRFDGWYDNGNVPYTANKQISSNITLTAKWVETITVTFNSAGGSTVDPVAIDKGTSMGTKFPAAPTKDGNTFNGWKDGGTTYTSSTVINDNITLTAQWLEIPPETVTVTFNANNGSPTPGQITVVKDSSMGAQYPTDPTRTDYVFDGWFYNNQKYTSGTAIGSNITLTAQWSKVQVTVTFYSNGGTPTPASRTIDKGSVLGALPTEPTRNSYVFDGWYYNNVKYSATNVINESITLTAQWIARVTVAFNTDGGSAAPSSITINSGSTLGTLPAAPTKANNRFLGWFYNNQQYTSSSTITSATPTTITLTARWQATVTVTFNTNGGSAAPAAVTIDSGATLGSQFPTTTPTKNGSTFVGWFNESTQITSSTVINSSITATAEWNVNVTFNGVTANGSASAATTQLTLTFSAAISSLAAADITLSGSTGAVKGALTGSGTTYTLAVSGITTQGTLTVAVAKSGYNISGSPKTATVYPAPATVSTVAGFAVPSTAKATPGNYQSKNNAYKIEPNPTYGYAMLEYSLAEYAGKNITITITSDVWVEAGTTFATNQRINWQVSNGGSYPTIAQSSAQPATGQWLTVNGNNTITLAAAGGTLYLSTGDYGLPTSAVVYIANVTVNIVENGSTPQQPNNGDTVTEWKGLTIPGATKATWYTTSNDKSDVIYIEPSATEYGWSVIGFPLGSYAGQEITVDVVSEVRLATAAKVVWQVNTTDSAGDAIYPAVAGNYNELSANTWHTVQGGANVTPTSGSMVYLSDGQFGKTTKAHLSGVVITITPVSSGTGPGGWVDPKTVPQTALSGGTTYSLSSSQNQRTGNLSGTSYHYEVWVDTGHASGAQLTWYGANQGGGGAFKAQWTNPDDYLGRVGYYFGSNGPQPYSYYKNIYVDYSYSRTGNNTAGPYSYIGVYGWSRNSSNSTNARLIEYYIVDDWFGNQYRGDDVPVNNDTIQGTQIGSFTVDGASYIVYKKERTGPSIDGNSTTFTQIFSVRQTLYPSNKKAGTISVTKHFDQWKNMTNGLNIGNPVECKFLCEAGGGTGWLDMYWLRLSQEDTPRN